MHFHRICDYRLKLFKIHLSNLSWCERRDLDLICAKKWHFQNSYYRKCAILWKYGAMNIISIRFDTLYMSCDSYYTESCKKTEVARFLGSYSRSYLILQVRNLIMEIDMKPPLALFDVAMSKLSTDIKNTISVRCANMTLFAWTVTFVAL